MRCQTARLARAAAVLGLLTLVAAVAPAQAKKVGHQFDPQADFSRWKTWGWGTPQERPEGHPLAEGGSLDLEIRQAITQELEKKGFRPAGDGERPDFVVTYRTQVSDQMFREGAQIELYRGVFWESANVPARAMSQGTLLIELADAESGDIQWGGWAVGAARKPQELADKAGKAVRKILAAFPPKGR